MIIFKEPRCEKNWTEQKTELNSSKQTLEQLFPYSRMSKSNCNEQHNRNCFDSNNDDNKWHLLNGFELMLFFRFHNKLANALHTFHYFSLHANKLINEKKEHIHRICSVGLIDWDWRVCFFRLSFVFHHSKLELFLCLSIHLLFRLLICIQFGYDE